MTFLIPSRQTILEMQNMPFDGKKNCFVPDEKEGFVEAEIESTKGEEVTVRTPKGDVSLLFPLPSP